MQISSFSVDNIEAYNNIVRQTVPMTLTDSNYKGKSIFYVPLKCLSKKVIDDISQNNQSYSCICYARVEEQDIKGKLRENSNSTCTKKTNIPITLLDITDGSLELDNSKNEVVAYFDPKPKALRDFINLSIQSGIRDLTIRNMSINNVFQPIIDGIHRGLSNSQISTTVKFKDFPTDISNFNLLLGQENINRLLPNIKPSSPNNFYLSFHNSINNRNEIYRELLGLYEKNPNISYAELNKKYQEYLLSKIMRISRNGKMALLTLNLDKLFFCGLINKTTMQVDSRVQQLIDTVINNPINYNVEIILDNTQLIINNTLLMDSVLSYTKENIHLIDFLLNFAIAKSLILNFDYINIKTFELVINKYHAKNLKPRIEISYQSENNKLDRNGERSQVEICYKLNEILQDDKLCSSLYQELAIKGITKPSLNQREC